MNVDAPEAIWPRNCKIAVKAATEHGWAWDCKLAAGFEPDAVELTWSVLLRCRRDGVKLAAVWGGPEKSQLSWAGGWMTPGLWPLSWAEFKAALTGAVKEPTAKALQNLEAESQDHLRAISALRPIAWPTGVIRQGSADRACKGKVANDGAGLPFLPCSGYAPKSSPLCESCTTGTIHTAATSQ